MNKLISNYAGIVVLVTALVFLLEGELVRFNLWLIAVQFLALCIVIYSRLQFRAKQFRPVAEPGNGPLVTSGPYRFVRHPVYAGVLLFLLFSVIGHPSLLNAGLWIVALCVVIWRISIEEQLLRRQYPEYPEYQRRTHRLIPMVY